MVTSRALNKRSTTILIAVVLALGTGLLAFNYLTSVKSVATTEPMRTIVVASMPIPVRTVVTPAMLTQTSRPVAAIDPDAVSDMSEVTGQIALISIPAGGAVSASKVGRVGLGGLTVEIPKGKVAISIALDRVKGVADLIHAGDHVDVIAVTPARASGNPEATTILRNKVVLAMGSSVEAPVAAGVAGATPGPEMTVETATLSLSPREAREIALADLNATLRLALRSAKDSRGSDADADFVVTTSGDRTAPAAPPVVAPPFVAGPVTPASPHVAAPQPRARHDYVPLIDGDKYTVR
jgi:pilus assembly protein CpaB